jgi:hypothetical protein
VSIDDKGVETRECYVIPRYGAVLASGTGGVDLAPQKVTQKKANGSWETI